MTKMNEMSARALSMEELEYVNGGKGDHIFGELAPIVIGAEVLGYVRLIASEPELSF